jgi:hypothetical protein
VVIAIKHLISTPSTNKNILRSCSTVKKLLKGLTNRTVLIFYFYAF